MRKVKTDNSDLIQYLDTVKELKNYIPIEEYRNEYRKLCSDNIPWIKIKKFKSAHTELRRLDKKRESLIELFIDELNPISSSTARTAAYKSRSPFFISPFPYFPVCGVKTHQTHRCARSGA